jgi:hypothetical protein
MQKIGIALPSYHRLLAFEHRSRFVGNPYAWCFQTATDTAVLTSSREEVTSPDQKAKEQRRVAAEKQSCLETAGSFTFRANLPNEKRRDEIR